MPVPNWKMWIFSHIHDRIVQIKYYLPRDVLRSHNPVTPLLSDKNNWDRKITCPKAQNHKNKQITLSLLRPSSHCNGKQCFSLCMGAYMMESSFTLKKYNLQVHKINMTEEISSDMTDFLVGGGILLPKLLFTVWSGRNTGLPSHWELGLKWLYHLIVNIPLDVK